MTATTWLDVMPALPLARGVPVVHVSPLHYAGVVLRLDCNGDPEIAGRGTEAGEYWRVDLDDPQGFAHALRQFAALRARGYHRTRSDVGGTSVDPASLDMAARFLAGCVTEADKLALARALRNLVG